ncbi:transglutaminase domain-containing protein [Flavobacterium sp. ZB4R12]|uniref:transglutaminase domain-containing protein n=1 Tax=Flavobacterium sp. ZB4R12 TaxID=3398732 RepID=UPI003AAE4FD0
MKNIYLILSFFFTLLSFGQVNAGYALIDKKMSTISTSSTNSTEAIANYINANFKTDADKIRAVFYWIASNISYDVANMFTVNFNETPQEQIMKTLKTKKGVCIHYAEVFNDISNKIGIQSYIIEGYTKQYGKVANLAHAWCAAKIDDKWYLFDPTWGSGYVNNGKFLKKLNENYFKAEPTKLISSHIPFDYLWQFLNYPITNNEFYAGITQINKSKKYFSFESEISKYNTLSEIDKLFESAVRIEKNGVKNAMILERLEGKKKEMTYLRQNSKVEKLNSIVNNYNEAVDLLNDFVHYRNNKFKPILSDDEISSMIQAPIEKLAKCQDAIYTIGSIGTENSSNLTSLKKSVNDVLGQAKEHELFVQEYLSKSKNVRKTMFTKVFWFGVPLN